MGLPQASILVSPTRATLDQRSNYNSTKASPGGVQGPGTQVNCFTGIKVQILTQKARVDADANAVENGPSGWVRATDIGASSGIVIAMACVVALLSSLVCVYTCRRVQKVRRPKSTSSVYLLYWYKSTSTDT